MRMDKHRVAVLLMLSALPHLLADDSSSLISGNDDVHGSQEQQEEQQHTDKVDDDVLPTTGGASIRQHQQQEQQIEPLSRPQHDTGESQYVDDPIVSSREYEEPHHHEERTPEEYSSSLATSDRSSDSAIESNKSDETIDDEKQEDVIDDDDEEEESATQAVHEDGFRLPALSKTDAVADVSPDNDNNHQQADAASEFSSSSATIESLDESFEEEKETRHDDSSSDGDESYDDDDDDDDDDIRIDVLETTKERILEDVLLEEDNLSGYGSIGRITSIQDTEVEDDEVVVVQDAKLAGYGSTGTTSTEYIEEEEGDDDDDLIVADDDLDVDVDAVPLEENDEGKKQNSLDDAAANTNGDVKIETSLENATTETSVDETEKKSAIVDVDDEISTLDENSAEVGSEEERNVDSKKSAGQEIDDVDADESTDELEGKSEKEEETEDEDEDLTDRVSVDYASKSAGSLIIEKSPEFKGTSNLIIGHRDKYAIVPCSEEKKYVVMSLSEDILMKEIKLSNYERFSSTIKDFQVKGSHTLGKWVDLGTFKAEPGNGEQRFMLENPTWARYLKFKFLTHHGVEHYCTLSQIQVHGSTMVQGFHEQWESIEENNEEQTDEQSDAVTDETKIDVEEKTDGDVKSKDDEVDSLNASNASIGTNNDPNTSTGTGDLDVIEGEDSSSNNVRATPSVHSKQKPLDEFRSPTTFSEILQGEGMDEHLFSDLYDLIPNTLSTLPAHSKNKVGSETEEGELRTVHQISQLAIESLYSFGSRIVDDIALLVTEENGSSDIVSPKMNDLPNEYYQKKFGSGLSSMIELNLSNKINHSSTAIKSSGNTATHESNGVPDEPTQSITEINEKKLGDVPEDGDKSSAPPAKKAESTPIEKASVVETNDSLDLAIATVLKDLPSAECLVNLNFAEFKTKVSVARKSTGNTGGSPGVRMMEPIFKKLTDEIFALQTSLSVHDQFAKMSVSCYQRVILDLALEMEKVRQDQDERLARLEEQILEPASMRMFNKLLMSVLSTIATWFVSNGSHLFVTMKNDWVPMICAVLIKIFLTLLDQSSKVIVYLSTESNGLAHRATYEEFLSAWSTYYDGGMAVVATVLTLLLCRIFMWCNSIRKRSSSVRSKTKDTQIRNDTSGVGVVTNNHSDETPASSSVYKRRSPKNRNSSKEPKIEIDNVSLKSSDETIPDLQDEIHETDGVPNGRDNPILNSPSVVSLEG